MPSHDTQSSGLDTAAVRARPRLAVAVTTQTDLLCLLDIQVLALSQTDPLVHANSSLTTGSATRNNRLVCNRLRSINLQSQDLGFTAEVHKDIARKRRALDCEGFHWAPHRLSETSATGLRHKPGVWRTHRKPGSLSRYIRKTLFLLAYGSGRVHMENDAAVLGGSWVGLGSDSGVSLTNPKGIYHDNSLLPGTR